MRDRAIGVEAQRLYEETMHRAMRQASRHVAWDQALEVAHDVASELVRRRATGVDRADDDRSFDALIHRAVSNRLRNVWRAGRRRAAVEGLHEEERSSIAPAWAEADGDLRTTELSAVVERTIASMPEGMRRVFVLIRLDELSYKETARRLGIGVGTVHTQFARANARLRQSVREYRADATEPAETVNAPNTARGARGTP